MSTNKSDAKEISRRSFLTGVAATGALSFAGVMAGCSSAGSSKAEKPVEASNGNAGKDSVDPWTLDEIGEPTDTIDADLCVIGAGGAGLSAGISAQNAGLDVVVIEKMKTTGGSFIGSEGLFAVGTQWQKDAGVDYSVDELVNRCLDYHHWIINPSLYKDWFNKTADTVVWLENLGVKFNHVQSLGDSPVAWHVYEGEGSEGTGVTFMKSFGKAAQEAQVPIELGCSGKKIVMEDGKVAGVLAVRDDGTVVRVNSKAVFVGTGGWANNPDLIRYLNHADPSRMTASGMRGRDGDGLKMMVDAGGSLAQGAGTVMTYGPIVPETTYGTELQAATSLNPHLWVNEEGKRFVPEDMFLRNFAHCGNTIHNQKRAFTVCNQAIIDGYTQNGGDVSIGVYVVAGEPMTTLAKDFPDFIDSGNKYVFKGDTVQDLAKAMGIDAAALEETMKHYNSMCAAGEDTEFMKPAQYMRPIEGGPYYAFEVFNGYFTTVGGIQINERTEVIGEDREVIPGLYAGGCDAGGLYGDTYDVVMAPGSAASWAINSGRMAVENITSYLSK